MNKSKLSIDDMDIRDYPAFLKDSHIANSSSTTLWQRPEKMVSNPFVSRLGSSRAFTLDVNDPNHNENPRSTPGAGSPLRWKESLDLKGFLDRELWKQAILEGWGTSMLVWLTGLAAYSLVPTVS